jgi:mannose-6-phosphate isomerase-like protein (cupin superfamily)
MGRPTHQGNAAPPPEHAGKMSTAGDEAYRARNRTHEEIREKGAISSLSDGIEIETHGIRTRIIAWPGNGFQTESVHVLTHRPGDESAMYRYDMADEAMICLKGKGEVFLRDEWVEIEPGDIAYVPEGLERATRNPRDNGSDFVLVNSVSPPQFDLYEPLRLLR